jgi:hypothetical protein
MDERHDYTKLPLSYYGGEPQFKNGRTIVFGGKFTQPDPDSQTYAVRLRSDRTALGDIAAEAAKHLDSDQWESLGDPNE